MPTPSADLRFDIDAHFAHLTENRGHDLAEELDWTFALRSDKLQLLEDLGEKLGEEFHVELQEKVETTEGNRRSFGPPMLSISIRGVLSAEKVKSLANRFATMANNQGLTYEGVTSATVVDDGDLSGWLSADEAVWRLRSANPEEMDADGVALAFGFEVEDARHAARVEAALEAAEVNATELVEEDGGFGVVAFIEIEGDEEALRGAFAAMEELAQASGSELLGVQFADSDEDGGEEDEDGDEDGDQDGDDDESDDGDEPDADAPPPSGPASGKKR